MHWRNSWLASYERRKQIEDQLKLSEEKFSKGFHLSPDAITITRLDGTFMDINEGFTRIYGFPKEEAIGKHAQSATVHVSIGTEGGNIKIEVVDDGRGFEISTVTKGFGLFNISERINHVGGYFHIDSKVGWGTRVILAGPLSRSGLGGA